MESNKQIKNIAKQQAVNANHQVMMQAPVKVRDKYFKELYESVTLETVNHRMAEEVKKMEIQAKKKTLEKLNRNSDIDNITDEFSGATKDDCVDVEVVEDEDQSQWNNNQSCLIKLV